MSWPPVVVIVALVAAACISGVSLEGDASDARAEAEESGTSEDHVHDGADPGDLDEGSDGSHGDGDGDDRTPDTAESDDSGATCHPALEITLEPGTPCTSFLLDTSWVTMLSGPCDGENGYLVVVRRPTPVEYWVRTTAFAFYVCQVNYDSGSEPCACVSLWPSGCSHDDETAPAISQDFRPADDTTITYLLWFDDWDGSDVALDVCGSRPPGW
jgi:hypothetical protein